MLPGMPTQHQRGGSGCAGDSMAAAICARTPTPAVEVRLAMS